MNKWELWWANVAFEDNPMQVKRRPVIVVENRVAVVLSVKLTSHEPRSEFSGEYKLVHWQVAGLSKESTARCMRLLKLQPTDFVSKIGRLHPVDISAIQTLLNQLYNTNT